MPDAGAGATRGFSQQQLGAIVMDTWRHALKDPQLAADDDFFTAGGDSLLADEVTLEIAAATGIEIPVVTLFTSPTAAEFTAALFELADGGSPHRRPDGPRA
jgi:hypothetical protein